MLCEECHQRPATVHVTKIINNQKSEAHLCQECAQARGDLNFFPNFQFSVPNLLAGFFNHLGPSFQEGPAGIGVEEGPPIEMPQRCENCGQTYQDFRRLGQLGCSRCYENFAAGLEPLLRRIHGNTRHIGKIPQRRGGTVSLRRQITDLRAELQAAISREEYERAAKLRDEIHALERKLGEGK